MLMNAEDCARRAILPDRGGKGGEEPDGVGAEAAAQEPDAEEEPGTAPQAGGEPESPSDDEDLESARPVVLGAAWRLPVVLLAMDGPEESGLDMRFDPETGEAVDGTPPGCVCP